MVCLHPSTYFLLPISYFRLPTPNSRLPASTSSFTLLPTSYSLLAIRSLSFSPTPDCRLSTRYLPRPISSFTLHPSFHPSKYLNVRLTAYFSTPRPTPSAHKSRTTKATHRSKSLCLSGVTLPRRVALLRGVARPLHFSGSVAIVHLHCVCGISSRPGRSTRGTARFPPVSVASR